MRTYDRVFQRDTAIGHAERNRQSIDQTRKAAVELQIEFAVINLEKAFNIMEAKNGRIN